MSRSISSLAAAGVLALVGSCLIASVASAQIFRHSDHDPSGFHHAEPNFDSCPNRLPHHFVPDVRLLDADSDSLVKIIEHLHRDAHSLSHGYEHSRGIESFVTRLERLQKHMHGILHQASHHGGISPGTVRHLQRDVGDSRELALRLDGELGHQAVDGALSRDFQTIAHMRELIAHQLFPILRRMEGELSGARRHSVPQHRRAIPVLPSILPEAAPLQPEHVQPVPAPVHPVRYNSIRRRVGRNVSAQLGGWSF